MNHIDDKESPVIGIVNTNLTEDACKAICAGIHNQNEIFLKEHLGMQTMMKRVTDAVPRLTTWRRIWHLINRRASRRYEKMKWDAMFPDKSKL